MKIEISVPEVVNVFKGLQNQPQKIFEMLRMEIQEVVGRYLSEMMNAKLTGFLGRDPYERKGEASNYRNGSYGRSFTLKEIGEVSVKVLGIETESTRPGSSPAADSLRMKSGRTSVRFSLEGSAPGPWPSCLTG